MKAKFKTLITFYLLLTTISVYAQKPDTAAIISYIKLYKDIAVSEMKRTGIPASITLAQGIHESGWGKSYLSQNTNNHFGIKCKKDWTGKTFSYTDDAPNECFRVYDKVADSYKDHSDFLKSRPWYASLFLLDKTDYKGWAYGLKKAGYATNPAYPQILIKMIEDFQLAAFDKGQTPSYINNNVLPEQAIEENEADYNVTDSMDVGAKKTVVIEIPVIKPVVVSPIEPTPAPSAQTITTTKVNKNIFKVNNCKAVKIYTSKGETLDLIANVLNIEKEDLLTYNDISDEPSIKDGQTIFIQQKKKSNKEDETYKVKAEDNIWSISQKKGIRLSYLLKMNKLEAGEEPAVKETLVLKGKAKEKPKLRTIPKETPSENAMVTAPKKMLVDTILRARDTFYPPIKDETKLSVDSNKVLGWESDTKLLEEPKVVTMPAKNTVKVPVVKEMSKIEEMRSVSVMEKESIVVEKPTPTTVYPKVIDYNSLPKSTTGSHTVVKGDTMYNICKRYNISIAQVMVWNNLSDQSIKLGQVLKIHP